MKEWVVYILRCGDRSLYTGVATDVAARLKKHRAGKGAAYTRSHLPVRLVYKEGPYTRSEALKREAALKRLRRDQKQALVRTAKGR
jgi:putative endonuclease